jgi:hypothetical protein
MSFKARIYYEKLEKVKIFYPIKTWTSGQIRI